MPDLDKVIKGLECCMDILHAGPGWSQGCIQCPYATVVDVGRYPCMRLLANDALELLKAQEPRVLSLDDIAAWVRQKPMDREPIYVEVKDLLGPWGAWLVDEIASYLPETDLSSELYGKTWRVWSARPTDAQREVVKWDDDTNPYL